MVEQIKKLYFELGIPVIQKDIQVAPRYTTIHYNLTNINHLNYVIKKTKLISVFIHKELEVEKSNIGHFAIKLENDNNSQSVDFNQFTLGKQSRNTIFAGVDDYNNPLFIDLSQTPHILISGMSGSGKSVMLNTAICSLLKTDKNKTNRYLFIDTKRVELSNYKKLPNGSFAHNSEKAIEYLDYVCSLIDARYETMEIDGSKCYSSNDVFVIIEELGDLMAISKSAVEQYIVKIARLGRACGVHLIIATQRPTVDVVTGEIKANIGCRFALQTTSAIDSRNIIGHNGAEKLKGKGDCLLKLPTESNEIHIQCPFVDESEIEKLVNKYRRLYE